MANPAQYPSACIVNGGSATSATGGYASTGTASTAGTAATSWTSWEDPSSESIAYSLLLSIACCEGVCVNTTSGIILGGATRQWILGTYAECLQTVNSGSTCSSQVSSFRQAS
jgi:hypothetical protein